MSTIELPPGPALPDSSPLEPSAGPDLPRDRPAKLRRLVLAYCGAALALPLLLGWPMNLWLDAAPAWLAVPLRLGTFAALFGGPTVAYLRHSHAWPRSFRPSSFVISDLPPGYLSTPFPSTYATAVLVSSLAGMRYSDSVLNQGDWLRELPIAMLVAASVGLLLFRDTRLLVLPIGLAVRRYGFATAVHWSKLQGPLVIDKGARELRIPYLKRTSKGEIESVLRVPIGLIDVDVEFLAQAVKYYLEHPEQRTAIGTVQELARLQAKTSAAAAVQPEVQPAVPPARAPQSHS